MRGRFHGGHGKNVKGGRSLLRYGPLSHTKISPRDKNHVAMLNTTLYRVVFHVTVKGGRDWLRGLRLHRFFVLGDHYPTLVAICHRKDGSMENHSNTEESELEVIHRSTSHPVHNDNEASSTRQPGSKVTALTKGRGSQFVPVNGSRCLPAWMIGSSPFIFSVFLAGCMCFFGHPLVGMVLTAVGALGAYCMWIRSVHTS